MLQKIQYLDFPVVFLVLVTIYLLSKEWAFNKRIRAGLIVTLLSAVFLIGLDIYLDSVMGSAYSLWEPFWMCMSDAVYPMMIVSFLYVVSLGRYRLVRNIANIAVTLNAVLALSGPWTKLYAYRNVAGRLEYGPFSRVPYVLFFCIIVLMLIFSILNSRRDNSLEYFVIFVIAVALTYAAVMDYFFAGGHLLGSTLAICACMYYYYHVAEIFMTDELTGLMNRHSMMTEAGKLSKKKFYLTIIDVDSFKMINDKYGHRKGDQVLVLVANSIRKRLPKQCKLYRFGSDEFAIISHAITREVIEAVISEANEEFKENSISFSYGTVCHEPGDDFRDLISKADDALYENRRKAKTEAIWDEKTGLYNQRGFLGELEKLKKQARNNGMDICVVAMDIERLGSINLAYGYAEGDRIIASVAEIINGSMNHPEFAGHLGNDEFVAAFIVNPREDRYQKYFIDKIRSAVKNSPSFADREYTIEINAATEVFHPLNEENPEDWVNKVLFTKQEQKDERRRAFYAYEGELDAKEYSREDEERVLDIIENNKLRYALQPIIRAKDGSIAAYEALMRACTDKPVSPATILRYAARNNKYYEIEKLTFANVLERIATDESIPAGVRIFINSIPGYTLKDADYSELREKYGEQLGRLMVEITEQSELTDEALNLIWERQAADGFKIAIDDFGSGSSNTYSLLRYRPECIKLDRLLITDIDKNTKKQYFANSIITFAKENGIEVLAEGVETLGELKMVMKLQVDYIQGNYTAKPSLAVISSIDEGIRREMITESMRSVVEGRRRVYVASDGKDVSLVQLALEEYTGITVASERLRIVGNSDYIADISIKIKDGINCRLELTNVQLNSVDNLPCIDVGEGAHLTLVIEGNCTMNNKGIHVPEGAFVNIKGAGDLSIVTRGHLCYGIGCTADGSMGSIEFNHSGKVSVRVDGEQSIAIGGGIYKNGRGIKFLSGHLEVSVAAVDAVGIGCFYGDVPIRIKDSNIDMDFRVNSGSAIGSFYGQQDIEFANTNLTIKGSGSAVSGVGSNNVSGGYIRFDRGKLKIAMSGQEIYLMGVKGGKLSITLKEIGGWFKGEGNKVLAIGSGSRTASVRLDETIIDVLINSAEACGFGTEDSSFTLIGKEPTLHINE